MAVMFIRISWMHPSVQSFFLANVRRALSVQGVIALCLSTGNTKFQKLTNGRVFCEIDNEELEELYCDVKLDECSALGFQISFESEGLLLLDEGYDVKFLFDNKLMVVKKDFEVIAQIRRLSTESYTTNPGNHVATVWTWYWKDEHEVWRQYDVDQSGRDLQRSFEKAFVNKTNCFKFRISDQDYELHFSPPTEMYQENLKYGTTRKVRRRPAEVKSGADILELKRSLGKPGKTTVPSHWSSMPSDKQHKRVTLTAMSSEYKEVETLFKRQLR
ncbi:Poly (ADP-ribose) polymerase [Desmophyllum pertusum]|uniref:Poly (ADP-ribose) polymerase n=1 Tax=Desmophyllum pertusum TaxID=174260 RepID=A0A9X0CHX3_9CNID|nr:Poly (ADP-ribose) polymerase [Desmophyllum pertusum]